MGVRMMDMLRDNLDTLQYEPTAKRVRVSVGGEPVADTCEARLVWEPRRVELDGRLLAESKRPMVLFETLLPVRFYLPREDVAVRLEPSDTASYCAYKGRASYYSVPDGPRDVAWTYHEPLHDAEPVRDRICFFDEHLDVIVDGKRRDRPVTPWSEQ